MTSPNSYNTRYQILLARAHQKPHEFSVSEVWEALLAAEQHIEKLSSGPKESAAEEYARRNPLGGPAKVFEAMAARIRAGEDYYAVLEDYGLQVKHPATGESPQLEDK